MKTKEKWRINHVSEHGRDFKGQNKLANGNWNISRSSQEIYMLSKQGLLLVIMCDYVIMVTS